MPPSPQTGQPKTRGIFVSNRIKICAIVSIAVLVLAVVALGTTTVIREFGKGYKSQNATGRPKNIEAESKSEKAPVTSPTSKLENKLKIRIPVHTLASDF